jgi:hypothetical protein
MYFGNPVSVLFRCARNCGLGQGLDPTLAVRNSSIQLDWKVEQDWHIEVAVEARAGKPRTLC